MSNSCACNAAPTLIFACSGAADVGALADQAARRARFPERPVPGGRDRHPAGCRSGAGETGRSLLLVSGGRMSFVK